MQSPSERPFPWVGLLVLAALIFTSVTSEFLPTGLLPDMARDLHVSESMIGFLVTVFAGTVVATSIPLSVLTRNHSRKALVIAVLLVFVVSNVLAAIAPNYPFLVGARVLGGMAHGLFWAVVGAYSAHLVSPRQLGRAVAITGAGGSAAFVLGVPVGTAIGHAVGWRLAFVVIAVVILLLTVVAIRFLPAVEHRAPVRTGEIPLPMHRDRTLPAVVLTLAILILLALGHNTLYTYVAPFLIGPVGLPEDGVPTLLFIYGLAGAGGLVAAGVWGDKRPTGLLIGSLAGLVLCAFVAGFAAGIQPVALAALVGIGLAFGGVPALMQGRLLRTASHRLRDIAAAGFTTSFNVAIAGGALLGGILLDTAGVWVLPYVDAALIAAALVLVIVSEVWLRRRTP